ncbi:hypothetical protein HaLaN_32556, partial [Haematococcus lacustris]
MAVPGLKPVAPSTINVSHGSERLSQHLSASRDGPVERDGGGRCIYSPSLPRRVTAEWRLGRVRQCYQKRPLYGGPRPLAAQSDASTHKA